MVEQLVDACATAHDKLDVAKAAMDAGVDVNAENDKGITALHAACGGCVIDPKMEEMVDLLLKHPHIDVNKPSSGWCVWCEGRNSTPLHCACAYGHVEIMRKLIRDPRLTSLDTKNSYGTPLMVAVDNWREEAVREMLGEAVDLQTVNSWGRSLVQQARYAILQ